MEKERSKIPITRHGRQSLTLFLPSAKVWSGFVPGSSAYNEGVSLAIYLRDSMLNKSECRSAQ